jgi:integrase
MARYWVETPKGPKRKTIYGKKRDDVAERLAKALSNRADGIMVDDKNLIVGDYLDRWLSDSVRGTVRESTFSRDKYLVVNHVKPSVGRLKLKNVNAPHLQGLYRERLDSGLSASTVQKVHHVLHKALAQAVRWDLIPRNPADAVKAPRPMPKEMRPLSAKEARRLLDAAKGDKLEALYVVAVTTGMRRGELLGLKWSDVDLGNTRLSIPGARLRAPTTASTSRSETRRTRRAAAPSASHPRLWKPSECI